jgi:hypothetical protein
MWLWALDNVDSEVAWWILVPAFFAVPTLVGFLISRWWGLLLPLVAFVLEAPREFRDLDTYRRAMEDPDPLPFLPPFFLSLAFTLWHVPLIALGVFLGKVITIWRRPEMSI